jgi:hypothetical protein
VVQGLLGKAQRVIRPRHRRLISPKTELERFHKCCSAAPMAMRKAVFLIFGVVSAQSQGYSNLLLRRSLARKSKILAALRYIFSVNALAVQIISSAQRA